jgi:hypothetical protein
MKKVFFGLMLAPSIAFASWTGLSCVHPPDNFTVSIEFDERAGRVRVNESMIVKATFTANAIMFTTLPPHAYFHSINRSNGVMMIKSEENGRLLTPYQCSVAKKKF